MFSQRDEEKYIIDFFKGFTGRFLDIGAWDGKTFSNTYQLALQGWGGVCVEPSPSVHAALDGLYAGNSKIQISKVGVGLSSGFLPFYDFAGDAIGSFDKEHVTLWEEKGVRKPTEILARVVTIGELLEEFGYDFNFINIDAEGWSVQILDVLPFWKLSLLKMVCVEFDHEWGRVQNICERYGFSQLHRTAENMIMVKG